MKSPVASFIVTLISCICTTFIIHLLVLNYLEFKLFDNKIVLSYIINFILALGIFLTLYFLKEKFKTQIGLLFIAGSLLKFLIFFLVFHPSYKQDGDISRLEFASFFIPYLTCLIIETLGVMKVLKNID